MVTPAPEALALPRPAATLALPRPAATLAAVSPSPAARAGPCRGRSRRARCPVPCVSRRARVAAVRVSGVSTAPAGPPRRHVKAPQVRSQ